MVKVPVGENREGDVAVPRMRRGARGREVRLNELGYRMAWLQSRVFAGRTLFLQRASKYSHLSLSSTPRRPISARQICTDERWKVDCYRNKTRSAIESIMQDVKNVAPHYETRVGKRRWNERMRSRERD